MKISTGFKDLDAVLDGGFETSSLVSIGGRPSMGKTALMLNFAVTFIQEHKKICFVTQELGEEQIFRRLEFHEKDREISLGECEWIFSVDSFSDLEILMESEILKGTKIFFIDYLQLLKDKFSLDSYEETTNIIHRLKRFSHKHECLIILASQLSRKPEERQGHRPILSDFRDSGAIEECSDTILMLFRREYYDPYDKPGMAEISIVKNRFGATKSCSLIFRKEEMLFFDYTPISYVTDEEAERAFSHFIPK